ncbi:hypothetical protein NKH85_32680 [Mesorhizobium sp. M0924]
MGSADGLSHGRAELCRGALRIGQDDGTRPQAERAAAGEADPQEGRTLIFRSSISAIEVCSVRIRRRPHDWYTRVLAARSMMALREGQTAC